MAKARPKTGGGPRSAARLLAVQALYQLSMDEDAKLPLLVEEYLAHRMGMTLDDEEYVKADADLFKDITEGAWNRREEWDSQIAANLNKSWTLQRIGKTKLAILRAGLYELAVRMDIPTEVSISEYVDVTHAFYDKSDASFVNAVLDNLASQVRGQASLG